MFGLKYNHHTVVSGDVSPTIGQDYNARWYRPSSGWGSRGTLRGSPVLGWPGWRWASRVSWDGGVRLASRMTAPVPTVWASPLTTAVSWSTKSTCCAVCLWKGSLSNLRVLITLLTSFFKSSAFTGLKNWDTIDISHCVSLTCTMYWFHTFIYCNMITTLALANTSIMSHSYNFFFVVRTIKM